MLQPIGHSACLEIKYYAKMNHYKQYELHEGPRFLNYSTDCLNQNT